MFVVVPYAFCESLSGGLGPFEESGGGVNLPVHCQRADIVVFVKFGEDLSQGFVAGCLQKFIGVEECHPCVLLSVVPYATGVDVELLGVTFSSSGLVLVLEG